MPAKKAATSAEARTRALRTLLKSIAAEDFPEAGADLREAYVDATLAVAEEVILTVCAGQLALNARDVDDELGDEDSDDADDDEDDDEE